MGRESSVWWRPRRADSPWLLAAGLLLAVVGFVVDSWDGPSWVLLCVGVGVVGGGALLEWRKRQATAGDTQDKMLGLASRALSKEGGLRTVDETSREDFRVHRGSVELDYVERDRHQDLRHLLVEGRPVLVVGHSMAGKTRMAYEVVRELYGDWPCWIPERPDGLGQLLPNAVPRGAVVWLDDVESYLTTAQPLRLSWLTELEQSGCRVVATIRASEYERFQPLGEVRPPQWEVLDRFDLVRLEDDQNEQARIASAVSDSPVAAGIRRYGVAEYVGGGYLAIDRFENGQSVHPLGVAMLRAASDWRLLGFEVIPNSVLSGLAPAYLSEKVRNASGENDRGALDWAGAEFGGRIRLLEPAGDGWRAFDYILDYLTAQNTPIPDETWAAAADSVRDNPVQAFTLGYRAYSSDRLDLAAAMWEQGATTIPEAAMNLGVLLKELGDLTGGTEALLLAMGSGNVRVAPTAAFNLGLLREEQGDSAGAAAAYQLAIDTGDVAQSSSAAVNLGVLRKSEGDLAGAAAAYQFVIDSGDGQQAPTGAFNLGVLRREQGDLAGAAVAYELAINSGHDTATLAALNLGVLRKELGDPAAAAAAWQRAIDSGDADTAPRATVNLAMLRREQGDLAGAAVAYQLAIDSGHADQAPKAAFNLGVLRKEQGDLAGAAAAYQLAIDSGHADQAPTAALNLGVLREEQGDLAGAAAAFQLAIDSQHADQAPKAALNLGGLHHEQGDLPGAAAAFLLAIDSGHVEVAPRAAVNLGVVRKEQGDMAGMIAAYQLAIDSGHVDVAPKAAFNLGMVLKEQGDQSGAAAAYQVAIDSRNDDSAPMAALNLGVLRLEQGDLAGAVEALQLAIDSEHVDQAPKAALNLGVLHAEHGNPAGAAAAWQLAIDSGHAEVAALARQYLHGLEQS
jgi:Tfp pilus assembly protein PilF